MIRVSKILESIIAQVTFDTMHSGKNYIHNLHNSQNTENISTLNALIDILSDDNTASSEIFKMYGVKVA